MVFWFKWQQSFFLREQWMLSQQDGQQAISRTSNGSVPWRPVVLQWRHNGHDGVSNHQPHDCLLNRGADQRKHHSSASLTFVRGIHRWPVNSPRKVPATRKLFKFDDVIIALSGVNRIKYGIRCYLISVVFTFTADGWSPEMFILF